MSLYISRLTLNSRHPRAKSELEHPYELHRTICKAFDDPAGARILFRPDADSSGRVAVIVQSLVEPDWSRLNVDGKYLIGKAPPKRVELAALEKGQVLRFRLRCRPSKRIGEKTSADNGRRRSITDKEAVFEWLHRKALASGFEVHDVAFDRVYWHDSKNGKEDPMLGGIVFDGLLVVADPDKLRQAVANGIGPQKAYGFGLLSLAPLR